MNTLLVLSACVIVGSLLSVFLSARTVDDHDYGYSSAQMYSDIVMGCIVLLMVLSWASVHWEIF